MKSRLSTRNAHTIRRIFIVLIAALLLLVWLLSARPFPQSEAPNAGSMPNSLSLAVPVFLQVANAQEGQRAGTNFLQEEAGISAYTSAGREISIPALRPVFSTIEIETDQYIVGSMALANYGEDYHVHIYAHTDGWVVAYYLKDEPVIKMMDWKNYSGGSYGSTLLEVALNGVLGKAGMVPNEINFFDFRYPEATNIVWVSEHEGGDDVRDSLEVEIPREFAVLERSWLSAAYSPYSESYCWLNSKTLARHSDCRDCWRASYGTLSFEDLLVGRSHELAVRNDDYSGPGFTTCTLSLLYQDNTE